MTPSGAKDGRLFSELPVPVYGPELVRNGGFDSGTGWSTPSGWSISNGTLQGTNVAAVSATQAGITFLNKSFRVEYTITEISQGDVRIYLGGTQSTPNRNAVGTYVEYIDITTANTTLYIQGINNFTGKIDNISVKEVSNIGDFTFSRGSNLAATRVGPTGLIEKGRENLFTQSNNFGHSDWNVKAGTFTQGVADPNGGDNAWSWTATNTDPYLYQSGKSVSGVSALSIWVKGVGSTIGASFEIRTGATPYKNITLTGDWQRVEHFNTNTSTTSVGFEYGNPAVAGDVVHIYQAQYEIGLAATDYIESGATTGKAGLLENEPRLDYSEGATCPSLLLEPSRTNLIGYSEYFNAWSKSNASVVFGNLSPEGLNNSYKLTENTAISQHKIEIGGSILNSQAYTFSVMAKAAGRNWIQLRSNITGGNTFFNLSDGTIGTDSSASSSIEAVGDDGWYRCSVTGVSSGTQNTTFVYLANADGSNSYDGDGTSGALIYGAQLEQGSYPTSYIPNHSGGGSVTRGADGMNNSSLGLTDCTFFVDFVPLSSVMGLLDFYDNSNARIFYIAINSIKYLQFNSVQGGTIGDVLGPLTIGNRYKLAFTLNASTGDITIFINGTKYNTYSTTISSLNKILQVSSFGYYNNTEFNQILAFPTALTDSECIKLTTL